MAKKKSTPVPEIQNEIISNWVEKNSERLSEIALENPVLYSAVNQALNYLNTTLGGLKPIKVIEQIPSPEKKWRVKTIEEFEKDFGSGWDKKTWDIIDIYGRYLEDILDESSKKDIKKASTSEFEAVTEDGYVLTKEMITDLPLPKRPEWRIKTEEEFIFDYGTDWLKKVDWGSDMNWLFGQSLENVVQSDYQKYIPITREGTLKTLLLTIPELDKYDAIWGIDNKMITSEPLPATISTDNSNSKGEAVDLDKENIKIKVETEEEAIAFQEWAFERGAEWRGGGRYPEHTKEKYFFVEDKILSYAELKTTFEEYSLPLREVTLNDLGIKVPESKKIIAVKKTNQKVNWTYLGAQRPNYLEILEILKKRRLSKEDKVQISVFFGNFSLLTKGTLDFTNNEKNREAEAIEYSETFTPNLYQFYQRYEVYTDYQDLIGVNGIVQPTDLTTYDWIQDVIFPMIKDVFDSSNDNLKVRNYIIEVEKHNRGFSLVEKEIRDAEMAIKKQSKKSALSKYKSEDDDLESALEDLEI